MVRIYKRIIKKHYLNQKRIYAHMYVAVPIPTKFHESLEPFLDMDLKIAVETRPDKLTITMTPKTDQKQKPFFTTETHPTKQQEIIAEHVPDYDP